VESGMGVVNLPVCRLLPTSLLVVGMRGAAVQDRIGRALILLRAVRNAAAQGQFVGRRRCSRRAMCRSRPGTVNRRRRRVVAVARLMPARAPTARARLWAITASASHAALALNRPEGKCAYPADFSSAIDCSIMAWRRCSASTSNGSPSRSVTMAW